MKDFTHLHVHTVGSLLDGYNRLSNLIDKVKELGMNAVAITDHGTLAETYTFNKMCHKEGIKPLLGCEIYYTHDMNTLVLSADERRELAIESALKDGVEIPENAKKKELTELLKPYMYDTKGYHLILIAKNQTGWDNLVKLTSEANDICMFNGRGHADLNLLRKYSEGLICTSACISSIICHSIRNSNIEYAEEMVKEFVDIFGDDFYLEIQPLNWDVQYTVNLELIRIANKYNIKLVATNDSHYTNEDDWYEHDVLLCMSSGALLSDENRMKYAHEYWIRSYDEMVEAFIQQSDDESYIQTVTQALLNTKEIADKVEDDIKLGSDHELLPEIEVPEGFTPETWLSRQCWLNLYKYLNEKDLWDKRLEYEARLKNELDIIITKGFASYILIVQDAINWGDKNGCSFGPGRGSGAGSLTLFLLGIVKGTDPIEYNLLFSRFLTMDRKLCPDIDSDVSMVDRQKLINYLNNKYGHNNTCQVGTVTTLGVKNGIQDVAKVLGYSFAESTSITKRIDDLLNVPDLSFKMLDDLQEEDENLFDKWVTLQSEYPEVIRLARAFEGIPRNYGVHAGGVLITPTAINDTFPTRTIDGRKVTVWDKNVVEEAGGVKYDFLGLTTISVIELCLSYINKNYDINLTIKDLYENVDIRSDENSFNMLKHQESEAVFQMESNLFKGLMRDIQPDSINDLIVITSLGRPGPLGAGMHTKYAKRKLGEEAIVMPLPNLEDVLADTYGTIVYQEQIMKISQIVAGFDDNQADTYMRKALAKKDKKKMALCREWLIYGKPEQDEHGAPIDGGIKRGYDEQQLLAFWEDLKGYATYLFNKSHATSYSLLSSITAWLKYYYPKEFFAAILSLTKEPSDKKKEKKRPKYIELLEKQFDIKVESPDINLSDELFTPLPDQDKILFGLSAVKGVKNKAIDAIIANRPYTSLEDFYDKVTKTNVNKTAGTNLIKAGAFDSINSNRNELLNEFHTIRKDKKDEVLSIEAYDSLTCMAYENEVLNAYVTYKPWIDKFNIGDIVNFEGKVTSVTEKYDKNGGLMAFVTMYAEPCTIELIVFSRQYRLHSDLFDRMNWGRTLKVKGEKKNKNTVAFKIGSIVRD